MTRIGLIIPSSNRMVEQEMVRQVPSGATAHVARLRMTGAHRVGIDALLPRVEEAAATLMDARCDVVAFHCTANSTSEGPEGEAKLLAAVRAAGAPLATTTAGAIRAAFDALAARRIVLITPYSQEATDHEAQFLREAGYQVLAARGFALKGSDEYCAAPAQFWRDRALETARPDADCYLLSCANISTFPVISEIEQKLGRAVVSSNQAVMFDALRLLGIADRRNCPGRVFETLGRQGVLRATA
jgi:maleate isomerase